MLFGVSGLLLLLVLLIMHGSGMGLANCLGAGIKYSKYSNHSVRP